MEAVGTKQKAGGVGSGDREEPWDGEGGGGREDRHSLIRSATKARRLLLAPPGCTAVTFSM